MWCVACHEASCTRKECDAPVRYSFVSLALFGPDQQEPICDCFSPGQGASVTRTVALRRDISRQIQPAGKCVHGSVCRVAFNMVLIPNVYGVKVPNRCLFDCVLSNSTVPLASKVPWNRSRCEIFLFYFFGTSTRREMKATKPALSPIVDWMYADDVMSEAVALTKWAAILEYTPNL